MKLYPYGQSRVNRERMGKHGEARSSILGSRYSQLCHRIGMAFLVWL